MRRQLLFRLMVIAGVLVPLAACGKRGGEKTGPFDRNYTQYAALLRAHVDADGWVDYKGLIADSALMRQAVEEFARVPPDTLAAFSKDESMAFWINAYNILTLQSIVDAYPVGSIKDIDGVWTKRRFRAAGRMVTLNEIEHEILRKKYGEPRIHFTIVCASVSCPALRRKPYTAGNLDGQLHDATVRFLTDTTRNRFDIANKRLSLSSIFDWFGADFERTYGSKTPADQPDKIRAVLNFIGQQLPDSIGQRVSAEGLTIDYLPYNWDLNEKQPAKTQKPGAGQ